MFKFFLQIQKIEKFTLEYSKDEDYFNSAKIFSEEIMPFQVEQNIATVLEKSILTR